MSQYWPETLKRLLREAGGLVTQAALTQRWGVSKATANEWTRLKSFPAPVARVGPSSVWLARECDDWLRQHKPQFLQRAGLI